MLYLKYASYCNTRHNSFQKLVFYLFFFVICFLTILLFHHERSTDPYSSQKEHTSAPHNSTLSEYITTRYHNALETWEEQRLSPQPNLDDLRDAIQAMQFQAVLPHIPGIILSPLEHP